MANDDLKNRVLQVDQNRKIFSNKTATKKQITELASVYRLVFGKSVNVKCQTCIIEAAFELSIWCRNNVTNNSIYPMSENQKSKFILKPGKLVQFGGTHYNMNNITDDVVVKIINSISSGAAKKFLENMFTHFPEDWHTLRVNHEKLSEGIKKLKEGVGNIADGIGDIKESLQKDSDLFSDKSLADLQELAKCHDQKEWSKFSNSRKKLISYLRKKAEVPQQ